MAVAKRQVEAARNVIKRPRGDTDKEIAEHRRLLRAHIKRLERRALKGPADDLDRIAAVKNLGAIVLAMYVAEHNLRQDMHRAIEATLTA
ncbi:MAG TPA: hypothetical protein VL614_14940 [Acetobacteraceae bacterium]|nr:hypothetical protein [Acetobacteraceae bacterium]